METATMGRVLVTAKIENLEDIFRSAKGEMPRDQVRTVEVSDALVDTGASTLMLPTKMILQLGLTPFRTRTMRTVGGEITLTTYTSVRLTIQGRECNLDVGEIRDDLPVLVGQIPLELLDWVVDPKNQRLIGNPDHNGEFMLDALGEYGPATE
jgi:predicted aspartyl protease